VGRKSWLYVTRHRSLSWLLEPCIGASVCLYAQVLGLDSRVAKCAVDLILYKSDPIQKQQNPTR
jgi:hypothetical protein